MTCLRVLSTILLAAMAISAPAAAQSEHADAVQAIDLKFPGGSVAEYIEAIRRAAEYLNVVVMPEVAQVRMQPVELKRVDPTAAVRLLHGLRQERPEGAIVLTVDAIPGELFRSTVYTVSAVPEVRGRQRTATDSEFWSLQEILEAETPPGNPEDVLTAVETALDMLHAHPDQIEAVDDVITALTAALRSGKPAERAQEVASLASQLDKARTEVQALRNELVESETRLKLYMMEIESLRQERKEMGQEMRRAIAERDAIINSLEMKMKLMQLEHQESSGGDG